MTLNVGSTPYFFIDMEACDHPAALAIHADLLADRRRMILGFGCRELSS